MSVPARMTMTAGAAGACAKLAATNAMVEIAASMYRIRTSWELGGHHTSSNAKTENWKPSMCFADLLPVSDVRDEDAGANNIFHAGPSLLQSRLDVLQRLHRLRVGIANADDVSIRRSGRRAGYMNLYTHQKCARVRHHCSPRSS